LILFWEIGIIVLISYDKKLSAVVGCE